MNRLLHYTVLAAFASLLFSCERKNDKPVDLVTFPLRGEVVGIDTVKMRLMVDHEEIPDYMDAMTMPFKVKRIELMRSVAIGDTIEGVLAVSRTESWLENFSVTGKGEPPDVRLTEESVLARLFKTGDLLPEVGLMNQEGRPIAFRQFRGKVVAITFIYSRCPLPDFCIRMSDHFGKVQRILKGHASLEGKWHLMSISFDPEFDTPNVLKEYGKTYGADFKVWDFATADMKNILRLTDGLGLSLAEDEGNLIAHNLRTVLLAPDGRIVEVINGNEWTPEGLVGSMKKAIAAGGL
jgi:protein SCO1/2